MPLDCKIANFLFALLFLSFATYGQQISVAVLPSDGEVGNNELEAITNEMRVAALKALPINAYAVLSRDVIVKRLGGPEKYIKECSESYCIVDLGKKAQVDYVARATVGKLGNKMRLYVELYNVRSEGLIGMLAEEAKNVQGLLTTIDEKAPDLFRKISGFDKAVAKQEPKAVKSEKNETPTAKPINGSFTDTRNGKTYKTVRIGKQTWMAENLNYKIEGSSCYGLDGDIYLGNGNDYKKISKSEANANCDKYGRFYDWATAMGFPSDCNTESCGKRITPKHRGVCPAGWHLPSNDEWMELIGFVKADNGSQQDARYLKSANGWKEDNGVDKYCFNAYPIGKFAYGSYSYAEEDAYFWSSYESGSHYAFGRVFVGDGVSQRFDDYKTNGLNVRCVMD